MPKSKRKRRAGLAPGSAVYVGQERDFRSEVEIVHYDPDGVQELRGLEALDTEAVRQPTPVTWVNIIGVHEVELVSELGRRFDVHPLVVEDLLNPGSRPKAEEYDDKLFLITKQLHLELRQDASVKRLDVQVEQVGIILGKGFVMTFQERHGDAFEPVRERIRHGRGRIRRSGADYLAYALIDALVDRYFDVLDGLVEEVEGLEQEVLLGDPKDLARRVHLVREDLRLVRKMLMPLHAAVSTLQRGGGGLVGDETQLFVRDLSDHLSQVQDQVDTTREALIALLDTHVALAGQRLNEVNQVLTIAATIFLPLSFMAGVYGMNFTWMPELGFHYGYPLLLGAMGAVAGSLVYYFRRKGWL
ncbi:MAG: magnesium/cobalt transporter CorA [Alphaproteobacteria bacterium]|nr:magnesium/cobalt transporter CorA [Alphaproteobacteria bacterium]MCB9797503.1 magnesium/cobalt transporter CorA [Alphaproteobacteria bacterium]